ncbi:MAG: serine O-acetyltransferase [Planctomycetes bacterium]|nr:serine O-acetyltransferase [Planctomycetota bacterium]
MSSHPDLETHATVTQGDSTYRLRELVADLRREVRDSGGRGLIGVAFAVLFSPRFHLVALYRIARYAALNHLEPLCAPLKWMQYVLTASEISPHAVLGCRVRFPHPSGIVIGAGAVIEDDAWVFQQVTLGSHGSATRRQDYPMIGRGARLYAGARVLGGVRVGEAAIVGANAVVLDDIPSGATAVGAPARVLKR